MIATILDYSRVGWLAVPLGALWLLALRSSIRDWRARR